MCLALPGELIEVENGSALISGRVSFAGTIKRVCLAYTPEACPGDYVLVHAGFSLSIVSDEDARAITQDVQAVILGKAR